LGSQRSKFKIILKGIRDCFGLTADTELRHYFSSCVVPRARGMVVYMRCGYG